MYNLTIIKTPDLARAIDMSIRNIRRYESGEIKFSFIKGADYDKQRDTFFYNAKVGLLVETIASPEVNETLFVQYDCQKDVQSSDSMQEFERLAKIGRLIGTWYFNDEFKAEMVK